jgi:NAD(P)H-dependent FMN reductase
MNRPPTAPSEHAIRVASADGYLFVVPEYNLSVPAVVKNALDLLAHEADAKPASIVSYSDTFNGGVTAWFGPPTPA